MPLLTSLALLLSARQGTLTPEARQHLLAALPHGPKNEILAGEIMVKFRPSFATQLIERKKRGPTDPTVSSSLPTDGDLVKGGTIQSQIGHTGWTLWRIPVSTDVRSLAKELKSNPDVLVAEPVNRIYPLIADPNDADWNSYEDDPNLIFSLDGDAEPFRRLWHLIDSNAPAAWTVWPNQYYTAANKPVDPPLIAVIDTGCDMDHPDFINAGGNSTDSKFGGQLDKSLSARFELGDIVDGIPEDLNGHGTHVTGIALASGNNGAFAGHGTLGTGYACRGMILRVFDDGGVGSDADAAAAIYYAIDHGADVINLSLGTTNFSQLFQDACTAAFQSGALVVAAGNEDGSGGGNLGPIYPAACSGVLGVAANGADGVPATDTYGGTGTYVDIAAPGGDVFLDQDPLNPSYKIQYVWSTASRDEGTALHNNPILNPPYDINYAYLAGTSMATPCVSGAAGLYYGKNGLDQKTGWANLRAYRALEQSATGVLGAPRGSWEPTQGYGCLDMESLLFDLNARGATVGALEGIVYYNSTALANVTVRAQKAGSKIKYQTSTRADGGYRFEMLPPGVYSVTAIPFGAAKTKSSTVVVGSDQTGVDFWCGTYSGDETAPIVGIFNVNSFTSTGFSIKHWAYDPDTGIDRMSFRIGTTPGATNVMADTEVLPESNVVTQTGLTIPTYNTFQARYVNGGNMTTTVTRAVTPMTQDAFVRDGSFANTNYGGAGFVEVKKSTTGLSRVGYMKIDTSAIPGDVSKVTLRVSALRWSAPVNFEFRRTSSSWNESTITWNNAPAATGTPLSTIAVTSASNSWFDIDITSYVQSERAAGRNVISLVVSAPVSGDGGAISSRETSGLSPQLIFTSIS